MSSSTRIRALALASALLLLVLLALLVWPRPIDPEAPAERSEVAGPAGPAQTRRARAVRPPAPAALEPTEPSAEPELVLVSLGDGGKLMRSFQMAPGFRPATWFPGPDEAPLPEAAVGLQEVLALEADGRWDDPARARAEDAFLAQAAQLLPLEPSLADDPWRALVALEAARRVEDLRWRDEAEQWGPLDEHIPERVWPKRRLEDVEALADAVWRAHADDAVGEFARMYAVHARSEGGDADDLEVALELLLQTGDDLVAEAAASALPELLMAADRTLRADELAALGHVVDGMEDGVARMAVALTALDQAVRSGDLDATRRWLDAADAATDDLCRAGRPRCAMYRRERDAISGQLAHRTGRPPTTWQGALAAAAWRCHLGDAPLPDGAQLEGRGQHEGRWVWSWEGPEELARCVARSVGDPLPPDGQAVRLVVR